MLAESWPPCKATGGAQHPLAMTILDTEEATKLLILHFQEVAGRTLPNYWRDQQDIFWSLGLLVFTRITTTKFISCLQKQTQKPLHPKREKITLAKYNTTILGDIGMLSSLLQSPG